jgi:hypothetical protein
MPVRFWIWFVFVFSAPAIAGLVLSHDGHLGIAIALLLSTWIPNWVFGVRWIQSRR